jgi:hypothetical protein
VDECCSSWAKGYTKHKKYGISRKNRGGSCHEKLLVALNKDGAATEDGGKGER